MSKVYRFLLGKKTYHVHRMDLPMVQPQLRRCLQKTGLHVDLVNMILGLSGKEKEEFFNVIMNAPRSQIALLNAVYLEEQEGKHKYEQEDQWDTI